MKKIVIFIFLVISLTFGGQVSAYSLLDGKLTGSFIIRNDSAIRLQDGGSDDQGTGVGHKGLKSGEISLFRSTIQLEMRYKLNDIITLAGTLRGWMENSLDWDSNLRDRFVSSRAREYYRYSHGDDVFREGYVDLNFENSFVRIGKQQIVWGEADGFRMADIINPLDYGWHYFFPSWQDIRIPLWGIDYNYLVRCGKLETIELVWLPGFMEEGFQGAKFAPQGANWGAPQYSQLFLDAINQSMPKNSIKNSEFGTRLHIKATESIATTLFYFYSRNDIPAIKEDWISIMGSGSKKFFEYPFNNKMGGTFNWYVDSLKSALRGECVFTVNDLWNSRDFSRVLQRNSFQYMLGFDRPTWIKCLNKTTTFFLSGQIYQKFIYNRPSDMGNPYESFRDNFTMFTFLANTSYMSGLLTPQIFGSYSPHGEGWIQPQVSYKMYNTPALNLIVGVGANIMLAHDDLTGYFGPYRDNNDVYTWVELSW